jgi:UDP-hydrolysing UDP-N-acetyl-D-glucosamine 2-epimerase
MKKILVPIVNRTNYSKLRPILKNLKRRAEVKLVLTSGASIEDLSSIREDIQKDGHCNIASIDSCLRSDSHASMSKNIALSMIQYSSMLDVEKPDLVLIVGDRFDMHGYALTSAIQNVKIAHIQGGERSGTIDDKIRFSITALSDYHFVSTKKSAFNVLSAGADESCVFNLGCPAVEHINELSESSVFSFDDLKKYSKRPLSTLKDAGEYILVQVHPNTVDNNDVKMEELLYALSTLEVPSIILYPNIDANSGDVIKSMRKFKKVKNFYYYKHFSLPVFVSLMKNAKCFMGNSSAIIRESALFGTPAINLGNRQVRRESNANVFDCEFSQDDILKTYGSIKDRIFEKQNLYFVEDSSLKISNKIMEILKEKPEAK